MNISFENKRILVTGAGRGIGKNIALAFVKGNAEKVFALSKTKSNLDQLVSEEPRITPVHVDLSDWKAAKKIVESLGPIDILVNNAAVIIREPFLEITAETFDAQFNINLKSMIMVSQVVVKGMVERKQGGSIVNVSSRASKVVVDNKEPRPRKFLGRVNNTGPWTRNFLGCGEHLSSHAAHSEAFSHAAAKRNLDAINNGKNICHLNFPNPIWMQLHGSKWFSVSEVIPRKRQISMEVNAVISSGSKKQAVYCATKAALDAVTRVMAAEFGQHQIRVNCVNPCLVKTDMGLPICSDPKLFEEYTSKIPLGRIAEPCDVVHAVLFLASDKANMTHGHALPIEGGMWAV